MLGLHSPQGMHAVRSAPLRAAASCVLLQVGVLAVQLDHREAYAERPHYDRHGRFRGYVAGWCYDSWFSQRYGPRFFCVDMGAFAFDAALLRAPHARNATPWNFTGRPERRRRWEGGPSGPELLLEGRGRKGEAPAAGGGSGLQSRRVEWRGGETEFLQWLLPRAFPEDLQPLGNCAHDTLVYHNGLQVLRADGSSPWVPTVHERVFCKDDGWWLP